MWCRIFSALLLARFTTIFLLSIRSFPIQHDLFTPAVRAIYHSGDHGAFRLFNDFSLYFIITFSSLPLPKDLSSEHPLGRKKIRYSVPKIDRRLELKWGLALLGEERAKEYIA